MADFKKEIARSIEKIVNMEMEELIGYIETPPDSSMGDFAFPCFKLAKELKKAPPIIASELKEQIIFDKDKIEKVEVVGGYLNFYTNKTTLIKEVLKEISEKKENYGAIDLGKDKTILIEYSSPNIAKPMHIGHLRNTLLGGALYKIYKFIGYHVIGANFLGDWGINFAKIMTGYFKWKEEYDFSKNALDSIVKIYVRFNEEEKEHPELMEEARQWHLKLEDGDEEATKVWNWLKEVSMEEAKTIYDLLDCKFDDYNGEAYYSNKIDNIINELEEKELLVESQGAKVVDLEKYDMPPAIILTSSGTSLYATRDIACLKDRMEQYQFEQAIYVVGSEQQLYFKQLFKVFELMGYEEYAKKCNHIYYGLILDSEGKKMGTRKGNSLTLMELLQEGIEKSRTIIEEKNIDIENKEELAKKIGLGAVIFNTLFNTKYKDILFNWENVLNFNGETGPYIQYTYVRTKSVLDKIGNVPDINTIDFSLYKEKQVFEVVKLLKEFKQIIQDAAIKYEPAILSRYLIELAQNFSNFYNECRILSEDKELQNARVYICYAVGLVLKTGASLLGIEMPDKM